MFVKLYLMCYYPLPVVGVVIELYSAGGVKLVISTSVPDAGWYLKVIDTLAYNGA